MKRVLLAWCILTLAGGTLSFGSEGRRGAVPVPPAAAVRLPPASPSAPGGKAVAREVTRAQQRAAQRQRMRTGASPVVVLTQEQIRRSGAHGLADLLTRTGMRR